MTCFLSNNALLLFAETTRGDSTLAKPLCGASGEPADCGLITLTTAGFSDCGCCMTNDFGPIGALSPTTAAAEITGFGIFGLGESELSAWLERGDLLSSGVRTGTNGGGIIMPCVGDAGADL